VASSVESYGLFNITEFAFFISRNEIYINFFFIDASSVYSISGIPNIVYAFYILGFLAVFLLLSPFT